MSPVQAMNTQSIPDSPAAPKKRRGKGWILWLLLLLLAAGGAAYAGWWYADSEGDKDRAALQKEIDELKAEMDASGSSPNSKSVQAFVQGFYDDYLTEVGKSSPSRVNLEMLVQENGSSRFLAAYKVGGAVDPVYCDQQAPESITADSPSKSGENWTVRVVTDASTGLTIAVSVIQDKDVYKIDAITCPSEPRGG